MSARTRLALSVCALSAVIFFGADTAAAQSTGVIVGTVVDASVG